MYVADVITTVADGTSVTSVTMALIIGHQTTRQ